MSYTKMFLLVIALATVGVMSSKIKTNTKTITTAEDERDARNSYLVNGATFSIGLMMAYPELLSYASKGWQDKITNYNNHFNLYEETILKAIDYSSDGMGDLDDYENCGDMNGFRYYIAHWSDKYRSVKYGICSPDACTTSDFQNFIDTFLYALYTNKINIHVHKEELITFLAFPRRVYDSNVENDAAKSIKAKHVLTLIIFTACILWVLFATLFHWYLRVTDQVEDDDIEHRNLNLINERELSFQNFILGFSVFRSIERLLNPYSKYTAPGLSTLRWIKFLWTILVVLSLFYYVGTVVGVSWYEFNNHISKDFGFAPAKASIIIVDIMLWISGIYTAFSIFWSIKFANNYSSMHILLTFWIEFSYKIFRILPIILFWVIYYGWIVPVYGSGPIFSELKYFGGNDMNKYWWTHFLFINNIHPKTVKQPMIWMSFFALEIQLFLVFFPMIVLIILNQRVGYLTLGTFWLASLITAFFYAKSKDLELTSYENPDEIAKYSLKILV